MFILHLFDCKRLFEVSIWKCLEELVRIEGRRGKRRLGIPSYYLKKKRKYEGAEV